MVGPNKDLWQRIHEFAIDDVDAKFTFTKRLARENGWSESFARRVVEEYKRFIFLAMVVEHEVTPSEEIDQAWHLHLVYTRSYWEELCGNVLKRPLHHGPTLGGQVEGERFDDNYRQTLASYEVWFDEEPPADIWPPANIRFGESTRQIRVNRARNWIVNKRVARNMATVGGLIGLSLAGLGAAAPLAAAANRDLIGALLAVILGLGFIALIAVAVRKSRGGSDSGGGCGGFFGCGGSGCGSGHGDGGSGCAGSGCGGGGCGGGGCGGGGD